MNFQEIRTNINELNEQAEALIHNFMLHSSEMDAIITKIAKIQNECPHEFIDGICIHCDTEEEL